MTLAGWDACARCVRHKTRLRTFAPAWPRRVKVLVLAAQASRTVQVAQSLEPDHEVVVDAIRARLGLSHDECVGDNLAACGLGPCVADDVAACSRRFVDQHEFGARPSVVVLFGRNAALLAEAAGLVVEGRWQPIGLPAIPLVVADEVESAITGASGVIGCAVTPAPIPPARNGLASYAGLFLTCLGQYRGHRRFGFGGPGWRTFGRQRVGIMRLRQHFAGRAWLSVFDPEGPWPFVIIDIDRHNAIQSAHFDRTVAAVRSWFPNGLVVRSSESGGVHVYVSLPPDTSYPHGALMLRAFVTLKGFRFLDLPVNPSVRASPGVRAQRIEVPDQPPRLPFGLGSSLLDDPRPLAQQIQSFCMFTSAGQYGDFAAADTAVRTVLKLPPGWSRSVQRRIAQYVARSEPSLSVRPSLAPQDPWSLMLPRIPEHLRAVAAGGVPAYGTRTRWTLALVNALTDLVPEDDALDLMLHWLRHRAHASEDLDVDFVLAEDQTKRWIALAYAKVKGVPERFWAVIDREVQAAFVLAANPANCRQVAPLSGPVTFCLDDARETAFRIARRFYDKGRSKLNIHHTNFGVVVGRNRAHAMRAVLTHGPKWLVWGGDKPVVGKSSTSFALLPGLWPPRPGEPARYAP